MMKKIVILLIIISNIFILTGCWNYSEIDKMAIVAGMAIDKGENGEKYKMTSEIIDLSKKDEISSMTVEGSGNTIFEAVRNTIAVYPQKLYYGHCKILIISEKLAREGIIPLLDVFLRDHGLRITADVLISKNVDAKEILLQKSESPTINSYDIDVMLENSSKSLLKSQKVQVYQIANNISNNGISSTLPVISIVKINNKNTYKLDGTSVFRQDKLVGFLNDQESQIFLFVIDKIKQAALSVQMNDEKKLYICAEVYKSKTSMESNYKNNELTINIKIKTTVVINDLETYTNFLDITKYKLLEKKFENQLQNNIKSLILKVQNDYGCDIFGFGKMINEENPTLWKKYKSNWNETFKKLKINVTSKFAIRSSGSIKSTTKIGD